MLDCISILTALNLNYQIWQLLFIIRCDLRSTIIIIIICLFLSCAGIAMERFLWIRENSLVFDIHVLIINRDARTWLAFSNCHLLSSWHILAAFHCNFVTKKFYKKWKKNIYTYIYICVCVCVCVCISYMYKHICSCKHVDLFVNMLIYLFLFFLGAAILCKTGHCICKFCLL